MSPPALLNPFGFAGGGVGYQAEVLADSPMAYWIQGEPSGTTLVDSGGGGHNGTYNGPTVGQPSLLTSDATTCASYDNNNDRADVTYGAWLDASTAFTAEIWIKCPNSGVQPMIDRDHSSGRVWQFRVNAGKAEFIKIGGTGGIVTATGVTTVNDNTARHIVATYDGSNIRIYVNASLDKTQAAAGTLGTGNSPLMLGSTFGGSTSPTNFYGGYLAHAAVYNTALSGARISAHFAAA